MKLTPTEPDVRTIVDRIDRGDIDLQPEFQRQEVWSVSKKKRLIDTVIRGWSIPPVHLVETMDSRLEVLDGQQRLAALRDFLHNKFSIDGRITPSDPAVQALHGKFYNKLTDAPRRRIDQYALRCFRLTEYSPEEPSELFYRLNQPTILTAGEQRNALFGPARQQLKELVREFEGYGNSRETLGFSNLRLAYDDVLARLLYFLEARSFGAKSTESRISERFRYQDGFEERVIETAQAAILFFSISKDSCDPTRFNKASLLSWLLFFSRFHGFNEPNFNAIQAFVYASKASHTANFVYEAAAVFDDRASLRVTDVSSVVYRDFVLCYIYYFMLGSRLPPAVSMTNILGVNRRLQEREGETFENALSHIIDVDDWSASL